VLPPLRERREDIPLLVQYFVRHYARRLHKRIATIPARVMTALMEHPWPGNIRELQNVIERAVILSASDTLAVETLWFEQAAPLPSGPVDSLVAARAAHERALIEAALTVCRGRVSGPEGAATKLGLPRQTLESKLKALGISPQRFKT
jgi:formate hydrogenlyase transcriptional activator